MIVVRLKEFVKNYLHQDYLKYIKNSRKKTDKYKLSISIPTYAAPKALTKNIKNLLKIQRNDIEIVVVDNDESGTQIKDFMLSLQDPRVKYYQNEKNIGRSNNIVKAVEKASADYVLLVSSDDTLNQNAIDSIIKEIEKNDLSCIFGTIIDENGSVQYNAKKYKIYKKGASALSATPFMGTLCPFVINKQLLKLSELYDVGETYMQTRLALIAATEGNLCTLPIIFATTRFYAEYEDDKKYYLPYETLEVTNFDLSSWDLGDDSHADPLSRAKQLTNYLNIIKLSIRNNKNYTRLCSSVILRYITEPIRHVCSSHDPVKIKQKVAKYPMDYNTSLNTFYEKISEYFNAIDDEVNYACLDVLKDVLKSGILSERDKCKLADNILEYLLQPNSNIFLYDFTHNENNFSNAMKLLNINISGIVDNKKDIHKILEKDENNIVLCNGKDCGIKSKIKDYVYRKTLLKKYEDRVFYMKDMAMYLTAAWLSREENSKKFGDFARYL